MSFLDSLLQSVEAVGKLLLVAAAGFFFVRRGILKDETIDSLARLLVDFIIPCALSTAMMKGFAFDELKDAYPLTLVPPLMIVTSMVSAAVILRLWGPRHATADPACIAMSGIPNSFYIPLPLAISLTPVSEHVHVQMLVGLGVMAVNPLQWTLGTWVLQGAKPNGAHRDWRTSVRSVFSGPVVGIVTGALLSQVPGIPEATRNEPGSNDILRTIFGAAVFAGQAMGPMAMVLIGALMARCHLGHALKARFLVTVIGIRLLAMPAIVFALLKFGVLPCGGRTPLVLLMIAASPSAMNLALAARRFGGDWETISAVQLVVTLVSLVTLPFWMAQALMMGR